MSTLKIQTGSSYRTYQVSERPVEQGDMVTIAPLYLEYIGGRSKKFWEGIAFWDPVSKGPIVSVSWGRIGCKGQNQIKAFSSWWSAVEFVNKKYDEKMRKKGYTMAKRPADRQGFHQLEGTAYMLMEIGSTRGTVLDEDGQMQTVPIANLVPLLTEEEKEET